MNKDLLNYVKSKLEETYCNNKYCNYVNKVLEQDESILLDNYKELLVSRFLDKQEFKIKQEFPFKKDASSLIPTKEQYVIYKKMIEKKLLEAMKEYASSTKDNFEEVKEELKDILLEEDYKANTNDFSSVN